MVHNLLICLVPPLLLALFPLSLKIKLGLELSAIKSLLYCSFSIVKLVLEKYHMEAQDLPWGSSLLQADVF